MPYKIEMVLNIGSTLGEGAYWDYIAKRLYWVDILQKKLHIYNPETGSNEEHLFDQFVSSVVVSRYGGLVLTLKDGFYSYSPKTRELRLIAAPESQEADNRFNDGKCDAAGRFFAGTMNLSGKREAGRLYRLNTDGSIDIVLEKVSISNGIIWSCDNKTMYYTDTMTREISAYEYDLSSGEVGKRQVVVSIPEEEGLPDGMTIDEEGMLWVALWGGGKVSRYNPDTGNKITEIPFYSNYITSCAFGGANLDELYITTANENNADSRTAGGLFKVKPGVKGVPAHKCGIQIRDRGVYRGRDKLDAIER
ncbi:SMP-30/gluconolactonase/LRE family protein [Paenibacillus beijingensis]|uniref:SMP-30/Gluconolactonase/LRE-like region domain-containing protein n=1 Tax=Paenibacillus beijingensis TaxID=1126833 RepID=A0A0D5NLM5_9BACL|nr:SMP-30/gluconolactonase/LRE family protein [Paenibacillus beijingensis]AJY75907.1 hypothetical protein VN24_16810 [Paenibacillus beijingensis]